MDRCSSGLAITEITLKKGIKHHSIYQACDRMENIIGRGENADYQYFLLLPAMFSQAISFRVVKGGYLDFSHLTELQNINIAEICMKKKYRSSVTKNHKIKQQKKKKELMVFP